MQTDVGIDALNLRQLSTMPNQDRGSALPTLGLNPGRLSPGYITQRRSMFCSAPAVVLPAPSTTRDASNCVLHSVQHVSDADAAGDCSETLETETRAAETCETCRTPMS